MKRARRPARRLAVVAVAAVALLAAALLLPPRAAAHAFLVRTTPRAGERLGASPPALSLQFSEPLAGGERVTVKTAGGAAVPLGPLRRLQGGLVVEAPVPPLAGGVYVVSWQVVDAEDGHLTLGEFAFAVGAAGQLPATVSRSAGAIAWPAVAARWLFLAGLLLAVGGLASERVVWAPVARRHKLAIPALPVGPLLALALAGGILQVLLLSRQAGGAAARAGWPDWAAALATRAGALALAEVALVAYGLWLLPVRRARPWLLLPLGLALGAAAVQGHAGSAAHRWAIPANVVHLGAVALWLGALAHLALVAWRLRGDDLRPAVGAGARRYAALALGLVAVALASGEAEALAIFSRPAELVQTTYGRVLLAKLVAVAATLGLALAARGWGLPAARPPRFGALRRLTRAEGALLLAAVAAAAVLANAPPPQGATAAENLLGPPPVTGAVVRRAAKAGWLTVYVAAVEGQLQVRVFAPSGDPAGDARLTLAGTAPGGAGLDIVPRACGPGCVTTAFPWRAGTTTLAVAATSKEWGDGRAAFAVPWPPPPEDPALLQRVIETMRAQPRVTLTERVTGAPGRTFSATYPLTGEQFVASEPYAAGGASDIRPAPAPAGARALTLYLPGSAVWVYLEIDGAGRLRRETVVTPGDSLERTFAYDDTPVTPTPGAGDGLPGLRGAAGVGYQGSRS